MRFRPCIDIHNGSVKQIVGGSLLDEADRAKDNFVSELLADFYAELYMTKNLSQGHVIILNPKTSEYYEQDIRQAKLALSAYPGGLQIGGGINAENAGEFISMGAAKVIVTSYVFKDGKINYDNLNKLVQAVGKEHLVLDLSCRQREGSYFIVTDRWQKYTDETITTELLDELSEYCDEFLVHAVDVEGKASGIETELVSLLGEWGKIPVTYAGGVHSFDDLRLVKELGRDKINVTIGSALDLFGGNMKFEEVLSYCRS